MTAAPPPLPALQAWRVLRLGSRTVVDVLVDPQVPPEVVARQADALPGLWYWVDEARSRLVLIHPGSGPRRIEGWLRYSLLLAATVVSTLGAGAVLGGTWVPHPTPGLLGPVWDLLGFLRTEAASGFSRLLAGWSFGVPLIVILLVHELGHYFAARRYAIDASLPFFLPIPPTLSPIGSLGAFIRLRSPILDRRQLLDVGAAGPLAGFLVAVAVLVWGYLLSGRAPIGVPGAPSYVLFAGDPIFLGESLLTLWLRESLIPGGGAVHLSLPAFAGWVGVFVTGLNLLPLSQLDGGHVLYGLFGRRQAPIGFVTILALLVLAQFSPLWYLWVVLALVIGGGRWTHPPVVLPEYPLLANRRWIGWACIMVFLLTFMPVPFGS